QRVDYTYDTGTNGQGRLAGITFGMNDNPGGSGNFSYGYTYNVAGRVTGQTMSIPSPVAITLSASYAWDTAGRMKTATYPSYGSASAQLAWFYDNVGRLNGMSEDIGYGAQTIATASRGPGGELKTLSYFNPNDGLQINETLTYNSLLQLTQITAKN